MMIITAITGLYGDGFLASPSLCGRQVWDSYGQIYGPMIHVGVDRPCSANAVYRAYMRFPLAGIVNEVVAATLNLHLAGKTGPLANVSLIDITDYGQLSFGAWSYSARVDLGTVITTSTALGWISVDVAARVQAAIAEGKSHIAFVLVYQDEKSINENRWYAISSAESGSGPYLEVIETAVGEAPADLAAYLIDGPKVVLQWSDPNSGSNQEDGYYIERADDGGAFAWLATTEPDATTHTDDTVSSGHTYVYRVRAHNSAGFTDYSPEAEATREYSGTPKPIPLGWCYNVEPVLIDEEGFVYQVCDPEFCPIEAIDAVYVVGLKVTTGFVLDLDLGTIDFDSDPGGAVTCDVRGVKDAGVFISRCGDLISWVLRNLGGAAAADLIAADFAQFNLDVPYAMGLYITDQVDLQEVLDTLICGTRSFCGPDGEGLWTIRQCLAPSGEADLELEESDIQGFTVKSLGKAVVWRCTIQGYRNWSVNSSPADGVSAARRFWLGREWRQGAYEDATIKDLYPLAEEAGPHQTCLARMADCTLLAQKHVEVDGQERLLVSGRIKLQGAALGPGKQVMITHSEWGFAAGRLVRVLKSRLEPTSVYFEAFL